MFCHWLFAFLVNAWVIRSLMLSGTHCRQSRAHAFLLTAKYTCTLRFLVSLQNQRCSEHCCQVFIMHWHLKTQSKQEETFYQRLEVRMEVNATRRSFTSSWTENNFKEKKVSWKDTVDRRSLCVSPFVYVEKSLSADMKDLTQSHSSSLKPNKLWKSKP